MDRLVATPDFLFGCHHSQLSRVFTIDGRTYRCAVTVERSLSIRWRTCPWSNGFPEILR